MAAAPGRGGAAAAAGGALASAADDLRAKLNLCTDLEAQLSSLSEQKQKQKDATATSSSKTTSQSARSDVEARSLKIRTELCEHFCDIILSDPDLAWRRDCAGRLWRSCFYGRITELRGRVAKERSRMKRCMSRKDADGAARYRRAVEGVEGNLKEFLQEARRLFLYILDKYQSMLLPAGKSGAEGGGDVGGAAGSDAGSGAGDGDGAGAGGGGGEQRKRELFDPTATADAPARQRRQRRLRQQQSEADHHHPPLDPHHPAVPAGVVPNIYKFLLYLGDIYRYVGDLDDATTCYAKAIRLAPGRGNPYNQLAVVAQLSDQTAQHTARPLTAVALYWYARSLLAVDEPFGTSKSNVERLFAMNREWVEKNACASDRGAAGAGSAGASSGDLDSSQLLSTCSRSSSRRGGGSRKAQLEASRAAKSAASRRFLAEFVEVHSELNRCAPSRRESAPNLLTPTVSNKRGDGQVGRNGQTTEMTPCQVAEKIQALNESLPTLLRIAAFSDALICKLVCISAFSYYRANADQDNQLLSAVFIFSFGHALAKQLNFNLDKVKKKKSGDLNIRLLHPFIVLCDLVSLFYGRISPDNSEDRMVLPRHIRLGTRRGEAAAGIQSILFESERLFWSSVAQIANTVFSIDAFSILVDASRANDRAFLSLPLPKDYEDLKGYAPFCGLFSLYEATNGNGVLDVGNPSLAAESDRESNAATYVTPSNAISALGLQTASLSQDVSSEGSKKCTGSMAETHSRIAHFLSFVNRHTIAPERGAAMMEHGHFLFPEGDSGNVQSMLDTNSTAGTSSSILSEVDGGVAVEGIEGTTEECVDIIAQIKEVNEAIEDFGECGFSGGTDSIMGGESTSADGVNNDNGSPPSVEVRKGLETPLSRIQQVPQSEKVSHQKLKAQERNEREQDEEISLQIPPRPLAPPGFTDLLAPASGTAHSAHEMETRRTTGTSNPFLWIQPSQQEVLETRGANAAFSMSAFGSFAPVTADSFAVPASTGFGIFGSYEDILNVGAEDKIEQDVSCSGYNHHQHSISGLQRESKNPFRTG